MPSRYCWAWMVTELTVPVSCPPPTVTWTLVFGPDGSGMTDEEEEEKEEEEEEWWEDT